MVSAAVMLSGLFRVGFVFAAGVVACGGPGEPSCTMCGLYSMAEGLMGYLIFTIAPLVATLAIMVYAVGLMWKAAEQNPAGVLKYKRAITAAVIGLIVIFLSVGMVNFVINVMDPADKTSTVFTIYTDCVESN